MFSSIRYRFIIIYFLLVFLAMSIVGFFITTQLENIQLEMTSKSMKTHITSIIASSISLQSENWEENISNIEESISSKVQIGYNENVYIILNNKEKTIIASSVKDSINVSAYNSRQIKNSLLYKSLEGSVEEINLAENDGIQEKIKHMSYPVKDSKGNIKGIVYLTNRLDYVYETVNESKLMLTKATMIALLITIVLGFIIANGITGPIKDLTLKAKKMSKGNFEQYVDVKSSDEIGQLGSMFNYLTKELKKYISELHREKSKVETTLNYMADGVLTVDLNGNIIHANPVARNILMMSDDNKKYDDLLDKVDLNLSIDNIKDNNWEGTNIFKVDKDTYQINYAPFKDDKNEIGGVILVIQDITEQYKLEKMRKEFVANVSHELKTPITTIKSYAETLLEGALENREITEDFLNVINSESDRMARLVRDLLKLSRLDYEQTKWNKVELDANLVMKDICKKLKLSAESKKIDLRFNIEEKLPFVLFDKDGLEQIILNVLSNAIKYTSEEGHIDIRTYTEQSNVIISVKDSGIGIPKEDINRIFERFYRVDKARSREMGGTGLGLSIAKYIAEAHNTKLEIESVVNVGTEIRIIIPINLL